MEKNEFFDLLHRYTRGECSEEEVALFDEFCERMNQYPEVHQNWDLDRRERIKLEIHTGIRRRIRVEAANKKYGRDFIWKIAASVLLLVSTGFFGYQYVAQKPKEEPSYITKTTSRGERSTITLGDGSVVQLNGESSISFPEVFSASDRTITLTGEAFFDVTEDSTKPFIVTTGQLTTTVLGTSFNIQAYPEQKAIEVTVASGKVRVSQSGGDASADEAFLSPSEQAVYNRDQKTLEKNRVSLKEYLAWKDDIIYLDGKTLLQTTKTLSRWYNVDFVFENEAIKKCHISGEFKDSSLENLLENIQFLTGIQHQITPNNTVILSGDGCHSP